MKSRFLWIKSAAAVAVLLGGGFGSFAQSASVTPDASTCTELTDSLERLRCFDKAFQQPEEIAVEEETTEVTNISEVSELKTEVLATPVGATGAPEGSGDILNRRDRVSFRSSVKALRARDKQRMVFLLENGEVWMQSSPRNLPIKEGDEISIKSGLMGGYIMRTSKGVSSRVNRIK